MATPVPSLDINALRISFRLQGNQLQWLLPNSLGAPLRHQGAFIYVAKCGLPLPASAFDSNVIRSKGDSPFISREILEKVPTFRRRSLPEIQRAPEGVRRSRTPPPQVVTKGSGHRSSRRLDFAGSMLGLPRSSCLDDCDYKGQKNPVGETMLGHSNQQYCPEECPSGQQNPVGETMLGHSNRQLCLDECPYQKQQNPHAESGLGLPMPVPSPGDCSPGPPYRSGPMPAPAATSVRTPTHPIPSGVIGVALEVGSSGETSLLVTATPGSTTTTLRVAMTRFGQRFDSTVAVSTAVLMNILQGEVSRISMMSSEQRRLALERLHLSPVDSSGGISGSTVLLASVTTLYAYFAIVAMVQATNSKGVPFLQVAGLQLPAVSGTNPAAVLDPNYLQSARLAIGRTMPPSDLSELFLLGSNRV